MFYSKFVSMNIDEDNNKTIILIMNGSCEIIIILNVLEVAQGCQWFSLMHFAGSLQQYEVMIKPEHDLPTVVIWNYIGW